MFQKIITYLAKTLAILSVLVLIGVCIGYYFLHGIHLSKNTTLGLKKTNAIYLAHTWVDDYHSRDEIHTLISQLIEGNISIAFLHSGPIEADGKIPDTRLKYAKAFLNTAKELAPDIDFIAWIGQRRDNLPIEKVEVRSRIASEAQKLVTQYGFQGIHLNIEPMQSDPFFIHTVDSIRDTFDKISSTLHISVAITPIVPKVYTGIIKKFLNSTHLLGYSLYGNYNDIAHIRELATRTDYVVLMGYDTGLGNQKLYQFFVEQEIIFLLKAAPYKAIFAIPSYEDSRPNFNPEIENITTSLVGVKRALSNIRVNREKLAGLAIYSHWTTDESEWQVWRNTWLKSSFK